MNGEKIKVLVFYKQQNWLEYGENIDLRMGHSAEKLNVKQRRVLTTKWIGEASEKLRGPQFQASMGSCFPITGCLITADGLEDHFKKSAEWLCSALTITNSNYTTVSDLQNPRLRNSTNQYAEDSNITQTLTLIIRVIAT